MSSLTYLKSRKALEIPLFFRNRLHIVDHVEQKLPKRDAFHQEPAALEVVVPAAPGHSGDLFRIDSPVNVPVGFQECAVPPFCFPVVFAEFLALPVCLLEIVVAINDGLDDGQLQGFIQATFLQLPADGNPLPNLVVVGFNQHVLEASADRFTIPRPEVETGFDFSDLLISCYCLSQCVEVHIFVQRQLVAVAKFLLYQP